jgi:hypothetical protein
MGFGDTKRRQTTTGEEFGSHTVARDPAKTTMRLLFKNQQENTNRSLFIWVPAEDAVISAATEQQVGIFCAPSNARDSSGMSSQCF